MYIITVRRVDGMMFRFQHSDGQNFLREAAKTGYFLVGKKSLIDKDTNMPMQGAPAGERLIPMSTVFELSYEEERHIIEPTASDKEKLRRVH